MRHSGSFPQSTLRGLTKLGFHAGCDGDGGRRRGRPRGQLSDALLPDQNLRGLAAQRAAKLLSGFLSPEPESDSDYYARTGTLREDDWG